MRGCGIVIPCLIDPDYVPRVDPVIWTDPDRQLWFKCIDCGATWQAAAKRFPRMPCPVCTGRSFENEGCGIAAEPGQCLDHSGSQ